MTKVPPPRSSSKSCKITIHSNLLVYIGMESLGHSLTKLCQLCRKICGLAKLVNVRNALSSLILINKGPYFNGKVQNKLVKMDGSGKWTQLSIYTLKWQVTDMDKSVHYIFCSQILTLTKISCWNV